MSRRRRGSVAVIVVAMALSLAAAGAPFAAASVATKGSSDEPRWLGSRTTDDGVTLRLTEHGPRTVLFGVDGDDVPTDCFPDANLSIGISTERVATETGASFFRSDPATRAFSTVVDWGTRPVQTVIVRGPKEATRAVARFSDGTRDESVAMGRYFVFARQAPNGAGAALGRTPATRATKVVLFGDDDEVLERLVTIDDSFTDSIPQSVDRPECFPPRSGSLPIVPATQPLPEPVGQPPADEDAARAAVTAAFEGAYPANGDTDAALTNVDGGDSAVVRDARQKASDANPQYVGRVTSVVTEVRFLDDREAAVRFEFRLDDQPFYSPQVGFAILTSDGWKMTRSTYCDQLQTAGPAIKC